MEKIFYYIGEQIVFSCKVDNIETDKHLGKICGQLVAIYNFYSDIGGTKQQERVTSSVVLASCVSSRCEKSWNNITLNIPDKIVTNFECKCMSLVYRLDVYVDVHLASKLCVSFPIVVFNGLKTVFLQPDTSSSSTTTGLPPSQAYQSLQVSNFPQAYTNKTVIQQPGFEVLDVNELLLK